jgi:NO-binding membrane sensor protein with MHYT domain
VAEVHHFAHGWLNPALAYVMAVLGCMVGLLHATKARSRKGGRRVRLLVYATLGIGGTGIWQMHFIAMLGFAVPASVVRYDTTLLAISFGLAVVVVGCGVFVAGFGLLRGWRLFAAGVLIGLGIAAMHYTGMAAIRLGGAILYEPVRFIASILVAIAAATAALWFVGALRGLSATILAALVMAAAISGMHYTAMAAVRVRISLEHPEITGVDPLMLVAPIVLLGGAAISMLAFFTFGASTVRDVRLIYEASGELSEPIEPWLIQEVLARTSRPLSDGAGGPGAPASHRAGRQRIGRSTRNAVVWAGAPVWGQPGRTAKANTNGGANASPADRARGPVQSPAAPVTGSPWFSGSIPAGRLAPPISAAVAPARYPPNDPGWDLPGVVGARAPEYRGNRRPH